MFEKDSKNHVNEYIKLIWQRQMNLFTCDDGIFNLDKIVMVTPSRSGYYKIFMNGRDTGDFGISTKCYREMLEEISNIKQQKKKHANLKMQALELQAEYAPGGTGYMKAAEDFDANIIRDNNQHK